MSVDEMAVQGRIPMVYATTMNQASPEISSTVDDREDLQKYKEKRMRVSKQATINIGEKLKQKALKQKELKQKALKQKALKLRGQ